MGYRTPTPIYDIRKLYYEGNKLEVRSYKITFNKLLFIDWLTCAHQFSRLSPILATILENISSLFFSSLGHGGSGMENVIITVVACGQVGPISYLILCLYIILIVFFFTLRITLIWPINCHCAYGIHSLGAKLCVEHFTCMDACKPHSSQWLLICCPFFICEETEAWEVKVKHL